jgi:hypothetical protein
VGKDKGERLTCGVHSDGLFFDFKEVVGSFYRIMESSIFTKS